MVYRARDSALSCRKGNAYMGYMASPLCAGKRLLLLLLVGATLILQHRASAGKLSLALPNCPDKCGNVSIPYPFGIGIGCFLEEDFEVICNTSQQAPTIYTGRGLSLSTGSELSVNYSKVLDFNLLDGEVRIQNTIQWNCISNSTSVAYPVLSLDHGNSLKVSYTKNKFTAIGCATIANIVGSTDEIIDLNNMHYTSACASFCDHPSRISRSPDCDGLGCCQTSLPQYLSAFTIGFFYYDDLIQPFGQYFSPCSYAFVVEASEFKLDPSYAEHSDFQKHDGLPLVLDWSVGNENCVEAKKNPSYACVAMNSVCINATNGPGYRCNCSLGYDGNPYLAQGCQDINECQFPSKYPCNGACTNTNGSYDCICPKGTNSENPKTKPCTSDYQRQVKAVIGTSLTFVFLVICISALLIKCQARKLAKEKERFFKQNGGHILYQQILSKQIDTVIIFTIEELKKATNSFDRSRELGMGGQGTVYKGILGDNREIAVKRSKIINTTQTDEFVQEIIILSQINHRNVVRLLGCCLEVEVPILVYEFIPNGTLFQLIHDNHGGLLVSLEVRLRIAQESAEALAYMHLSINRPIVHGDVKSLNILLGDNLMAKVTDFGASRMLPKDAVQFMTLVQGTLGYLDPEYLQERQLTDKSDVYSFGVVLLELITRKTAIYFEDPTKEGKYLASSFQQAMKENRAECMLDTSIMGVGMEELVQEVAELASLCLSSKGGDRPSMTQVADKLKALRRTWRGKLLLQHELTKHPGETSGGTLTCPLSPSMYWTARMMGMDIETPQVDLAGTTNMS